MIHSYLHLLTNSNLLFFLSDLDPTPQIEVIGDNLCGITGAGDGIGESETELNDYDFPSSLNDCAILVKSQYPNANGATWDGPDNNGLGHCYAEFGQTSRNNDVDYTNVLFVDCPVSIASMLYYLPKYLLLFVGCSSHSSFISS